jgi:elongation factor 1-beta
MKELEANVRKIQMDGLAWGASKMVPVGYGINMLEIHMVVEDEKVSIDTLQELIAEDEDHVQSSDIVSFVPLSSRRASTLTLPQSAMQKHS